MLWEMTAADDCRHTDVSRELNLASAMTFKDGQYSATSVWEQARMVYGMTTGLGELEMQSGEAEMTLR